MSAGREGGGRPEMCNRLQSENLKGKNSLRGMSLNGSILLKCSLNVLRGFGLD
jgi:hypothetical protein